MTFKVLIVGGGIGGLAVAHALTRATHEGRVSDLEVIVYEQRADGDESAMQQYPLHLDQDGRDGLRGILTPNEYEQMIHLADQGIDHGGIAISTPAMKPLFKMRQYENEHPQFIHRWLLKDILSKGVSIKRGRRVLKVVEPVGAGIGKIEVVFDDGTSELADLVVDGVGSALRSQKYPSHAQFARLPYLNIQMKLSTDTQRLPKLIDPHGINLVLGTKDYSLLLVPLQSAPPAQYGLTINPLQVDLPPVKEATEPLVNRGGSYLFAILTIHTFTGWQDTTPADWRHKVVRLLEADQADKDLIHAFMEETIPGTIGEAWQVVQCSPDDPVPYNGGRVVLIGDAAHAMPPQAGAGASTALMDAHRLSQAILSCKEVQSNSDGGDALLDLLPAFHTEMMSRANRHVKDATRRLYLSNRSGMGVYTQRATLGLMNVLWPVMGWFSGKKGQ